jgi:hypothetical protein
MPISTSAMDGWQRLRRRLFGSNLKGGSKDLASSTVSEVVGTMHMPALKLYLQIPQRMAPPTHKSKSSGATFRPAPHRANPVKTAGCLSAEQLLKQSCPEEHANCAEILHSFIGRGPGAQCKLPFLPATEGLVSSIAEAYNNHRALILRPDDVWLAILGQFHLYVNAHAEELRQHFVAHEGKQKVVVKANGCRYSVDFGVLAHQMTKAMDEFIVDPSLRNWVLPKFSTTTHTDTVVASVVMMATLKAYFEYTIMLCCGIPQVTLEGEKKDWEEILHRAAKLTEYGEETTGWFTKLQPVLTRFVRAFDDPNSAENLDFWQRVMHYDGGSGPTWLSGWITAFCFFDNDGKRIPHGWRDVSSWQHVHGHERVTCIHRPATPSPSMALSTFVSIRQKYLADTPRLMSISMIMGSSSKRRWLRALLQQASRTAETRPSLQTVKTMSLHLFLDGGFISRTSLSHSAVAATSN